MLNIKELVKLQLFERNMVSCKCRFDVGFGKQETVALMIL